MPGFPPKLLAQIAATKYFRIRAGKEHRFIAVWVVVVDGRVLLRPWNDKPTGWYRAFLKDPNGAIELDGKEIPIQARKVRGTKLSEAMDRAYAEKYTTKPNQQYVKGFATSKRQATTVEFLPVDKA